MNTLNVRMLLKVHIIVSISMAMAASCLAESGPTLSQNSLLAQTRHKLAKLQIPFIANQGESNREMKFYARTFAGTVFVTETGKLVYSLPKVEGKKQTNGVVLKEELIGGKVTKVKGESPAITKLNYFKGNDRSKWQRNIPAYDFVSLGEVYEGIEVKLKAQGNNVEKLFYVQPGSKPETIKMRLSGGKGIRVNQRGELEVETEHGTVRFSRPVAFQEDGGKKDFVEAAYAMQGNEYGFKVADYDRARQLVIDPILAATFLGGSDDDAIRALVLDSTENVYVAGFTVSSDFPGVDSGSADSTGDFFANDGFVAKLNSDLSSILAATFLGGSGSDPILALTFDTVGNVYVAGATSSETFPGVGPGSADSTNAGPTEVFVAKLNSDLSSILAATFFGGGEQSFGGLALDANGNVYVAGSTGGAGVPGVGPGSADSTLDGDREGFVAKLNSGLSSILAATFLGGSDRFDDASALALDSTGNVYVAGSTNSPDFPGVGPRSADSTHAGTEGFVAKLNSGLSSILAATFLGGSKGGSPAALVLDAGNVYVAGSTDSSDFPGVGPGSADSTFAGAREGFVAKLNSDLSSILAATFLGGSNPLGPGNDPRFSERADALAIDSMGNVYAAGFTSALDFPGV